MKDTNIDIENVKVKLAECSSEIKNMSSEISSISTNLSLLASIWNGEDSSKSVDTLSSANNKYSNNLTSLVELTNNLEAIIELYEEADNTDF